MDLVHDIYLHKFQHLAAWSLWAWKVLCHLIWERHGRCGHNDRYSVRVSWRLDFTAQVATWSVPTLISTGCRYMRAGKDRWQVMTVWKQSGILISLAGWLHIGSHRYGDSCPERVLISNLSSNFTHLNHASVTFTVYITSATHPLSPTPFRSL